MIRVLRKEFREHRGLILWLLLGSAGLIPLLEHLEIIRDQEETAFVMRFLLTMTAACLGASLVGPEVERGTLEILWTKPIGRWRIWAGKALFGLIATAVIGGALALALMPEPPLRDKTAPLAVVVWPMLAMAGFAGGFAFSGAFSRPLAAGLSGFLVAAGLNSLVLALRLRPAIYWPTAMVALLLVSGFTYRVASGSRERRLRALAAGLLAATMLFPAVTATTQLVSHGLGSPRVVQVESMEVLEGRGLANVWTLSKPSLLSPFLAPGGSEWRDGRQERTALVEPATGRVSWGEGTSRRHYRVSADHRWSLALFYPEDEPGRLEVGLAAAGKESHPKALGLASYPTDWLWDMKLIGVQPDGTLFVSGLRRDGIRRLATGTASRHRFLDTRDFPYARARVAGDPAEVPPGLVMLDGQIELRGRVDSVTHIGSENEFLVVFNAYGWRTETGNELEGRWRLLLDEQIIRRVQICDRDGLAMPDCDFVSGGPRRPQGYELFRNKAGTFGLCKADGSDGALLTGLEGVDVSAGIRSSWWSEDGRHAVLSFYDGAPENGSLWSIDVSTRKAARLPQLPVKLIECVPMEGGAYALTNDGKGPSVLWWAGAGVAEATVARQTPNGHIAVRCRHDDAHSFALEWTGSAKRKRWGGSYEPSSLESGCFTLDGGDAPCGASWKLLVLRPPAQGGLVEIPLGSDVRQGGVSVIARGDRCLVRSPLVGLAVVNRNSPAVRPLDVAAQLEDPLSEMVWVDDRMALLRTPWRVVTVDAETGHARTVIDASP